MLSIDVMNIQEIREKGESAFLPLCPEDRRKGLDRFKVENPRLLSLAAGVLEHRMLAKLPPGTKILREELKKPVLSCEGYYYNLSHSGEFAVLALADAEVGIDIQEPGSLTDALQQRILSEKEKASGLFRTASAWFLLWSTKEAYTKLTGKGLSLPFPRLETSLTPGTPEGVIRDLEGEFSPAGFRAERFANGYSLAVCIYLP